MAGKIWSGELVVGGGERFGFVLIRGREPVKAGDGAVGVGCEKEKNGFGGGAVRGEGEFWFLLRVWLREGVGDDVERWLAPAWEMVVQWFSWLSGLV